MSFQRRASLAAGVIALTSLTGLGVAQPAAAEPSPCAGVSGDKGSTRVITSGAGGSKRVTGTWYNCGGGTGADRVRIDITGGYDSNCITVAYISTGSITFETTSFTGTQPTSVWGWTRC